MPDEVSSSVLCLVDTETGNHLPAGNLSARQLWPYLTELRHSVINLRRKIRKKCEFSIIFYYVK